MPATAQIQRPSTPEQILSGLAILPPVRSKDQAEVRHVGQILYTPGVLPYWGDEIRHVGSVDREIPIRIAARAAQLCVHNIIAIVRAELGSLDSIEQVMQINVLVNCSDGFENVSRVADGASEALYQVFGPAGRHHRTVIPTAGLPDNAVVQVSAIFRTS